MMKFVAKTFYGLEGILAEEIKTLGASDVTVLNRAVAFSGNEKILYKANYCLRTALSVLRIINQFNIRSKDDLYRNSKKTVWDRYMSPEKTFSVVPVVKSPFFSHTGYAGLVLKDAVADWFREKTGKRPSVDPQNPDILLNLHISNDFVTVSVDSSLVPLYKRGWRKERGPAPINEVLAAGIVQISGWSGNSVFLDPMCGSGTIAIEGALTACNIPPGKFRSNYGFMKWNDFNSYLFEEIRAECEKNIVMPACRIYASDVSEISVSQSIVNVKSAGLMDIVAVERKDFSDLKVSGRDGVILMNPPYGERLPLQETDDLYGMIGSTLKHNFAGFSAWVISPAAEAMKKIGLRPSSKRILFNGPLECTLARYDLYQGTRKTKFQDK